MRKLLLVFISLIICIGCNQNSNYTSNRQQNKLKASNQPTLVETKPISKESSVSYNKNYNKSEEHEMNINMKTELDSYPKTADTITVIITNKNDFKYNTGKDYIIEYYDGSTWDKIPLQFLAHDIMITLLPQEPKEFKINLFSEQYQYKSGKYRICKTIYTSDEKHNICAQFNIK